MRLREALASWQAVGLRASQPPLLGLLAEAEQLAGEPEEALLRRLEDALGEVDWTGESYVLAELHRLRKEESARACRRGRPRPRPPSPPRSTWPVASAPSCWRTGPPPAWPSSGPRQLRSQR